MVEKYLIKDIGVTGIEELCLGTNNLQENYHKQLKFVSFVNRLAIRLIRGERVRRCLHEGQEVLLCSVSIIFHHKSAISVIFDGRVAVHALFVAQICVELKNTNKFKDISNESFPDPYPSLLNIFFLLNECFRIWKAF